jgi:hypothetical protein
MVSPLEAVKGSTVKLLLHPFLSSSREYGAAHLIRLVPFPSGSKKSRFPSAKDSNYWTITQQKQTKSKSLSLAFERRLSVSTKSKSARNSPEPPRTPDAGSRVSEKTSSRQ